MFGDMLLNSGIVSEVLVWYNEAAIRGSSRACVEIGKLCCSFNNGIEPDFTTGFGFFLKAHYMGNLDGTKNVALCYIRGAGVRKNLRQARLWIDKLSNTDYDKNEVDSLYDYLKKVI